MVTLCRTLTLSYASRHMQSNAKCQYGSYAWKHSMCHRHAINQLFLSQTKNALFHKLTLSFNIKIFLNKCISCTPINTPSWFYFNMQLELMACVINNWYVENLGSFHIAFTWGVNFNIMYETMWVNKRGINCRVGLQNIHELRVSLWSIL